MQIKVLGCYGGMDGSHRLTSFLVDGSFAVDAGSLTGALGLEEQQAITDVFISHSHLDHTGSLPFLADNIFGSREEPLRIYGHAELLAHVREHIFNDISWPDFAVLPSPRRPTIEYVEVTAGEPFRIGRLEATPVWVNHQVPTTGLIVTDAGRSWIFTSDTADTEEIWGRINALPDPRLLFLECSYPNRLSDLADASMHLSPAGVGRQLARLERTVPTRIYHVKPVYLEEISRELAELDHPDLRLLAQDEVYEV